MYSRNFQILHSKGLRFGYFHCLVFYVILKQKQHWLSNKENLKGIKMNAI